MSEILREVEDAFFDIPFENSAFQNEAFVVASQITPGRAYRAIGLRITAKLRALNEALFAQRRLQVDLLEIEEKLAKIDLPVFERMRAEIDKEQKLSHEWMTKKLVRDAEVEVQTLYNAFKRLPRITRDQFEQEEVLHFKERLLRQTVGVAGASESLMNMSNDFLALVGGTFGDSNLTISKQADENQQKLQGVKNAGVLDH